MTSLRRRLRSRLNTYCLKHGWNIKLRYPFHVARVNNGVRIGAHLSRFPLDQRWSELRRLAKIVKDADHHDLYDAILASLVPGYPHPAEARHFIGDGSGKYSLKTCRHIQLNGRRMFEKTFKTDSTDFAFQCWLKDSLYSVLGDYIDTPN